MNLATKGWTNFLLKGSKKKGEKKREEDEKENEIIR